MRSTSLSPFFSRSQQVPTDAVILVAAAYCELDDVTVCDSPVHRIGRLIESDIHESHNFAADFGNKRDTLRAWMRRTLEIRKRL